MYKSTCYTYVRVYIDKCAPAKVAMGMMFLLDLPPALYSNSRCMHAMAKCSGTDKKAACMRVYGGKMFSSEPYITITGVPNYYFNARHIDTRNRAYSNMELLRSTTATSRENVLVRNVTTYLLYIRVYTVPV